MTRFDSSILTLWRTVKAAAGRSGSFSDGTNSVTITAVPGSQLHDEYDAEGVLVTRRSHDWIFLASELILDSAVVLPQQYDTFTVGGVTYEVVKRGDDKTYRYVSEGRQLVRGYFEEVA